MKKGIHPENYRPVVFKDMSNEHYCLFVLSLFFGRRFSKYKN